ncbi:hypothetical protein [Roseiterribacter gracilis]|uniref:Uncharacterized protein n=1 Tax=Roseiterribacter gracilis TaxID=2812848 RepID=A0A8S8XJP0_9PROT|nr:hypothetical protein TMPK1_36330 [Rhodospirillales bacterium TMPK1]
MDNFLYNGKRNLIALLTVAVLVAVGANHAHNVHVAHTKIPVVEVIELT